MVGDLFRSGHWSVIFQDERQIYCGRVNSEFPFKMAA